MSRLQDEMKIDHVFRQWTDENDVPSTANFCVHLALAYGGSTTRCGKPAEMHMTNEELRAIPIEKIPHDAPKCQHSSCSRVALMQNFCLECDPYRTSHTTARCPACANFTHDVATVEDSDKHGPGKCPQWCPHYTPLTALVERSDDAKDALRERDLARSERDVLKARLERCEKQLASEANEPDDDCLLTHHDTIGPLPPTRFPIERGARVRHYKGGEYVVLGWVYDATADGWRVEYAKRLTSRWRFTRTPDNFFARFDPRSLPKEPSCESDHHQRHGCVTTPIGPLRWMRYIGRFITS